MPYKIVLFNSKLLTYDLSPIQCGIGKNGVTVHRLMEYQHGQTDKF